MYVQYELVNFAMMKNSIYENLKEFITKSPEETILLGEYYAALIKPGDVIGLNGNLGTGKTQFAKGIGKYFQVKEIINSPTFNLVNEYIAINPKTKQSLHINHFDLYRLKTTEELLTIGFEEYINPKSICVIEWSTLAEAFFEKTINKVFFDFGEKDSFRIIKFE